MEDILKHFKTKKIVLIGNGFDRNHKLPTSYVDFLNWWIKKKVDEFNSPSISFDEWDDNNINVGDSLRSNPNLLRRITENPVCQNITSIFPSNYFIIKNTLLFNLINRTYLDGWVNIESFYFKELVFCIKNGSRQFPSPYSIPYLADGIKSARQLNEELELIKDELKEYIKVVQENAPRTKRLSGFMKKYGKGDLIVNFNYTNTIERYYNRENRPEIVNIHGTVSDEITFGYGNENDEDYKMIERMEDNSLLDHIKSFNYALNGNYKTIDFYIKDPGHVGNYHVDIIGLSCGLSDGVLLNDIFNNEKCTGVTIYYHESERKFKDTYQNISRHFDNPSRLRSIVNTFDEKYKLPS